MLQVILWKHCLESLTITRNFLPVIFLFNAAAQDLKNRELDASAWVPMIMLGIVSLGVELAASLNIWKVIMSVVVTLATLCLPYFFKLYELGDAIMMIGLGLTHISTMRPVLGGFFLRTLFPDFGLTVLWNTELIMIVTALLKRLYDLASGGWGKSPTSDKSPYARAPYLISPRSAKEDKHAEASFLKHTIPLVSFLLPGYVVTILFGSLVPPPFQP